MQKGCAAALMPFRVLIIAVAVVLLVVMVYPFFLKQHNPVQLHCINNLRQLGIDYLVYAVDHGNVLPDMTALSSLPAKQLYCIDDVGQYDNKHGYGLNSYLPGRDRTTIEKAVSLEKVLVFADSRIPNSLLHSLRDINRMRHTGRDGQCCYAVYLDGHASSVPADAPIVLDWEKMKGVKR